MFYRFSTVYFFIAAALFLLFSGQVVREAFAVDARVLPKGRFRVSLVYGHTAGISETYNGGGNPESLTKPYELELKANKMTALRDDIKHMVNYLNSWKNYRYDASKKSDAKTHGVVWSNDPSLPKLGDALARGFLDINAKATIEQYNLFIQYGLTDKLSVGFSVPYIKSNVDVDYRIKGNNTAEDIYKGFALKNPNGVPQEIISGLGMAKNLGPEQLQGLLTDNGYSRFGDFNANGLGDIILGGRYNYLNKIFNTGTWIGSGQLGVTVPTGKVYAPSEITALDFGQGAWDAGVANIINYSPASFITLSQSTHYTYRFSGKRDVRVRKDASDLIPGLAQEETVNEKLGNKFWVILGTKFQITSAISLDASYEWYWKTKDVYAGSQANRDYGYLSDKTNLYLETLQLGASISSLAAFKNYKFPIPGDLSFNYYIPIRGKNAIIAPFGTAEVAIYF